MHLTASPHVIARISSLPTTRRTTVRAGTILCRQGEPAGRCYVVASGTVAAEVDGYVVAEFGPGSVVGERGAAGAARRNATLRAASDAELLSVPAWLLAQEMDDDDELAHELGALASARR